MPQNNQPKPESVFKDFTNLYELSKTLRFELRPIGNTQKMLNNDKVFEKDKVRQEKYIKTKPYFDKLHREFVSESLQEIKLTDLENYYKIYQEFKKDSRNKQLQKKLSGDEARLRKEILNLFNKKAKDYSEKHPNFKKRDIGIFFEEEIFGLLKEKYGNEKETMVLNENNQQVSIFDEWKKFTGYFLKFHETRKNFYTDDGTSTAIATRIIDQNLRRFCDNLQIFERIKDKIKFLEIENNFNISINNIFLLSNYNKCVLQEGIDTYNKILGGETVEKTGAKKKGVNELVNEYRQKTGEKLPFLKLLDKQILSEKEKFIDDIENEQKFFEVLEEFYQKANEKIGFLRRLSEDFVKNNDGYDLDKVYLSKEAFNTISNKWADDVYEFQKVIADELKIREKEGSFSFPNFIAVLAIKNALEKNFSGNPVWKSRYYKDGNNNEGFLIGKETAWKQFLRIFEYEFNRLFKKTINKNAESEEILGYDIFRTALDRMIAKKIYSVNVKSKIIIKNFADDVLLVYQMGKYFSVEKKRIWNPENLELGDFYANPEFGYLKFYENSYEEIVKNYNHIRNYLTKKPWEENKKWKLNFENPTLAGGFDKNKESSNFAVILKKQNRYYLGLMKKGSSDLFEDKNLNLMRNALSEGKYEKMVYKYFPEASKMIPKCTTQLNEIKAHFAIQSGDYNVFKKKDFIVPVCVSKRIYELNNVYYYKDNIKISFVPKNEQEKKLGIKIFQKEYLAISGNNAVFRQALRDWIDFCMHFLKSYKSTSIFDYSKLKKVENYNSLDEFYQDINSLTYDTNFTEVSEKYIEEKNHKGELYLFEIHNKDWNQKDGKKKTGAKNLHTLYFENLFSPENESRNFILKLNGQAELFFRPKTDEVKLTKKNDKKGNKVIDHKRYAKDKILFHCPITLNRGKGDTFAFNKKINECLADNPEINIIGIDRGEKHLVYYSVITQTGKILETGSLNKINGINYADKLDVKAKKREQERIDWQEVEGIKDLKKGYGSQVIRRLADLAIKYNAIIVFEDLNMRFKQIRGGIEKSTYQQIEKALIEKLNFLVEKGEKNPEQAGNLLKAYQLTAPFETFKDMGKQTGIIFYTQAEYTSITDPVTGFRKNIYVSNSSSIEKTRSEINKFIEIGWDNDLKSYYFKYDAKEFNKNGKGESKEWVIYANVPRIRKEKENGYWVCKSVNPNTMLSELFSIYGIEKNNKIKQQIKDKESKNELGEKEFDGKKRNFYKSLVYILNLILQVRNSFSEADNGKENYIDFISSPVFPFFATKSKYSKANFDAFEKMFLSNIKDREKIKSEFNGDANGAFNIARKGIVILNKIAKWRKENEKLKKESKKEKFYPDLYISYLEWDKFVQNQQK